MRIVERNEKQMLHEQFKSARQHIAKENFDEAARLLRELLQRLPENYSVISNLAFVSEKQKKLEDSIKLYKYGFELNPSGRDELYNYGRALQKSGDLEASMAIYRDLLSRYPNDSEALINLDILIEAQKSENGVTRNKGSCFTQSSDQTNKVIVQPEWEIISLVERTDRRERLIDNFESKGINRSSVTFRKAEKVSDFGCLGCSKSHVELLKTILGAADFSEKKIYLVGEDDLRLKVHLDQLNALIYRAFSIFSAHAFLINATPKLVIPIENSEFARSVNAYSTAGYAIKGEIIPDALKEFSHSVEILSHGYDLANEFSNTDTRRAFLTQLQHQYALDVMWQKLMLKYQFLVSKKSISIQEEGFSNIELSHQNYSAVQEWKIKK